MPQNVDGEAREALEAFREATSGRRPRRRTAAPGQGRAEVTAHDQRGRSGRRRSSGDDVIQFELTDDTPVYVISVAAAALRAAPADPAPVRPARPGLAGPDRGPGAPLLAARHRGPARGAAAVQDEGVNLAGIKRILELERGAAQPYAARRDARRDHSAPGGARVHSRGGGQARRAAEEPEPERHAGARPSLRRARDGPAGTGIPTEAGLRHWSARHSCRRRRWHLSN